MMRLWVTGSSLLLIGLLLAGCVGTQPVSTHTLLAEMTDLSSMAEYPQPPYTCRQFSSFDRASKTPNDEIAWFANADYGQFLRVEEREGRQEYVMMDADGPGAIVRLWSANPTGTLRIYLDDNPAPALEAPMADLLGGKVPGIPEPIACMRSGGWNSYLPIPYARHCKVTSDVGGFYYHVNYRTYPRGTEVRSFKRADLRTLAGEISFTAKELAAPRAGRSDPLWFEALAAQRQAAKPGADKAEKPGPALVKPGEAIPWQVTSLDPGAVVGLRVRVEADDRDAALRKLVLLAEFDGEQTIACPLGDFFGAGPGVNAYESLPLGVSADGEMWSHWVMPFCRTARLQIHNLGDQPARVSWGVATSTYHWTDRSLHFHAGWRVARDVPTRPFLDWNYVSIKGQGVFAGAAFSLLNPVKAWWGEGDEKIYVDGEEFPSHFGTGTEDYFGYAWSSNQPYVHAYHSQPRCDGPGSYGRTAVNRWHLMDRIPFRRALRFDMELWHWWDGRVPEMSVVTYWYGRPLATSEQVPPQPADLALAVLPPYVPKRVPGVLEGEDLRVVEKTGKVEPQALDLCSNEQQLWWRDAKLGDKLVVAFPAPEASTYRVFGRFVKAPDYGTVQLSLNGKPAGAPLDLYAEKVTAADEMLLGEYVLLPGDNMLGVESVGANERAAKKYMAGLDYLRLERAN
jgi:hypothetical protein